MHKPKCFDSDQISSFTILDSLSLSSYSIESAKRYKQDSYSDFESIENDSFFQDTQKRQDDMDIDSEFFSSYNAPVQPPSLNILANQNSQDKCLNSGFKTANLKDVFINQNTIQKLNKEVPIFSQLPPDLFNNILSQVEIAELSEEDLLISSLDSLDHEELVNETFKNVEKSHELKSITNNSNKPQETQVNLQCNSSSVLEGSCKFNDELLITGFKTGNNKPLNVKNSTINQKKEIFSSPEKMINSGFMTGNKKAVFISKETVEKIKNDAQNLPDNSVESSKTKQDLRIYNSEIKADNLPNNSVESKPSNEESFSDEKFISPNSQKMFKILQKFPSHMPMRSYSRPEKGHISTEVRYLNRMAQIYQATLTHFKDENFKLIYNYFKWAWMSLFIRKESFLATKIISIIKKMKEKEYSFIKRVLEGDDIPMKYVKLLVIGTNSNFIELFDGFYSIKCTFDSEIQQLITKKIINVGDRVKIFNFKLLFTPPINILEQKDPLFSLNYNSFYKTNKPCKLGYQKKSSFLQSLTNISKSGGPISCLLLQIKRIIQISLEIKYENYSKVIKECELEKETYKIIGMLNNVNKPFNNELFRCTRYISCIAKDNTGECLLIWYTTEEIKKDEIYYFFNTTVDVKKEGLCLVSKKGFYIRKDV